MKALLVSALVLVAAFAVVDATVYKTAKDYPQQKIEHLVVLMLENRSFDHMLGWLKKEKGFEAVNGLTGTETNPMNCSDPKSPLITISHHADYEPGDMGHEVVDTTEQLTCDRLTDHSKKYTLADMKMNGFITNAHHTSYGPEHQVKFPKQAMEAFPESEVPVIWKLARTSGLADNYYCSVPGPTQNNRLFFHCGSVSGLCINFDRNKVLKGLGATTMYKLLEDNKISWGVYMHDLSSLLYFKDFRSKAMLSNVHLFNKFLSQAKAGSLPAFSFIEPRYFDTLAWQANDQHPSHPVPYGEELIKQIYETLRSSPKWKNTAFVITYDEHGGFYDHVVPPLSAPDSEPNPCTADGGGPKGFRYNRMGLRVPFIVVSPWVPAKLFNSLAPSQKPAPDSVLEHTSVWQTIKLLFGAKGDLSVRSKWAANFANWFSLTTPRTDHPFTLPAPAKVVPNPNNQPNGLQHDFTVLMSLLIGVPAPTGLPETKAGEFVMAAVEKAQQILDAFDKAKASAATAGKKTVEYLKSTFAWLTGSFVESASEVHSRAQSLQHLHDAITQRSATVKQWFEVGMHAPAPRHRSGRAGHNKVLSPEAEAAEAARFAQLTAAADAEAKVQANMPFRSAAGELIGPNAANPLFDVDTYINNGPFFMPGILSTEAESEGLPDKIYNVFHDA